MDYGTDGILLKIKESTQKTSGAIALHLELLFRYKHAVMDELIGIPGADGMFTAGAEKREMRSIPLTELLEIPGTLITGTDAVTAEPESDQGVPVVVPDALRDLRYRPEHCPLVDTEVAARYGEQRIRGMDIMMVVAGDDRGRCAILPLMHPGAVLGPVCIALRVNNQTCNPFYLNNVLHHYLHTGYLAQMVEIGNVVDRERLLSLPIPVPGIEEQQRIADRLLHISARIVDAEEAGQRVGRTMNIL